MGYAELYARAFRLEKWWMGMMNSEMIDCTIRIIMEGIKRRKRVNLIINDRAWVMLP